MLDRIPVVLLALAAALSLTAAPSIAQPEKLELRDAETVRSVLERHVGKRVGVVLATGLEMTGIVTKVTGGVVHLSELAGRELSDAVVVLDRINAVVIRVRSR